MQLVLIAWFIFLGLLACYICGLLIIHFLSGSPRFFEGWRQFGGLRWWTAGGYYQEEKRKACRHERDKQSVPSWFGAMPRLGVRVNVVCDSCGHVMGQAEWQEVSPLNFEIKFIPNIEGV